MTMIHEHKFASNGSGSVTSATGQTAWQVIEDACSMRVTGELALTTSSPTKTKVYLMNGLVYFAERETDDALSTRLVLVGAVDARQLQNGMMRLNGVDHLGRLFDRDPSIDRDAVEVAIEMITEETLTEIADQIVHSFRTTMYRHHSSGIHRWYSSLQSAESEAGSMTPMVTIVQHSPADSATAIAPTPEPVAAPVATSVSEPVAASVSEPVATPVSEPVAAFTPLTLEPLVVEPAPTPTFVSMFAEASPVIETEPLDVSAIDEHETWTDESVAELATLLAGPVTQNEDVVPEPQAEDLASADVDPFDSAETWADDMVMTDTSVLAMIDVAELTSRDEPMATIDTDPTENAAIAEALADTAVATETDTENEVEADVEAEAVVEASLPNASPWGAPVAVKDHTVESAAGPTPVLPFFDKPPVMRISHDAPTERTLPTVLTNAGPSFVLDPNGPRLPGQEIPPLEIEIEPEIEPKIEIEVEPEIAVPAADAEHTAPEQATIRPLTPLAPLASMLSGRTSSPEVAPATPSTDAVPPAASGLDAWSASPSATPINGSVTAAGALASMTPTSQPAAMRPLTPLTPLAPLASPLDSTTPANTVEVRPTPAPAHLIPELGAIPVPEDVAAAVRRAIAAIEAATANTGPSAVNFGPLTVTSAGQPAPTLAPMMSLPSLAQHTVSMTPAGSADVTPTAPEGIEAVQNADGLVTPLLSLGGPTGLQPMAALQPMSGLQPMTALQPMTGLQPMAGLQPMTGLQPLNGLQTLSPMTPTQPSNGGVQELVSAPGFAPPQTLLSDIGADGPDVLGNPQAPAITTARRGALRRLIDGIRRR